MNWLITEVTKNLNIIRFINTLRAILDRLNLAQKMQTRNEIASEHLRVNSLSKHANKFNTWRKRVKPLIEKIDIESQLTLKDIADCTDFYSTQHQKDKRYTRHIFYKILNYLFNALSHELLAEKELSWSSGLCTDLNEIIHLQADYQEIPIIENKEFNQLLSVFFERLTLKQEQLYQASIERSQPIFKLLEENSYIFQQAIDKLKESLDDNEVEGVGIKEHPTLFDEYNKLLRKLEFFTYFNQIKNLITYNMSDKRLSQVILLGFYFMLLDQHDSWGRNMPL